MSWMGSVCYREMPNTENSSLGTPELLSSVISGGAWNGRASFLEKWSSCWMARNILSDERTGEKYLADVRTRHNLINGKWQYFKPNESTLLIIVLGITSNYHIFLDGQNLKWPGTLRPAKPKVLAFGVYRENPIQMNCLQCGRLWKLTKIF